MYVTQHNAKDFRNLENAVISPDRSINIIFGENGQGKTNLIESIWLFTGCHSFRTRKNSQLIRENCERSMLDISFFAFDRDQTARLELTDKKNVWINGVHKDTPRRLIGEFPAVLFSPATLSIVQDGPGERRKFVDIAISLVKPNYADNMIRLSSVTSLGTASDSVSAEIDGDDVEIGFNNKYLTDALRVADTDEVNFKLNGPVSPIIILPPEGDSFLFLVLPVRIKTE